MIRKVGAGVLLALVALAACKSEKAKPVKTDEVSEMQQRVDEYAEVELTTSLSHLSENEVRMLPLLIKAAELMDDIFWEQAYGSKQDLFFGVMDEPTKQFLRINYGPWDRMRNNEPFMEGVGAKPAGANFYPTDMTKDEFEQLADKDKVSQYTVLRRDDKGVLKVVPYHTEYKDKVEGAAKLLIQAAELADDAGLKTYLTLRADALLTDEYRKSDMAWMDMKTNRIDFVAGPIENYEDELYGYKAAHEAYLLVKDMEWSGKLTRFVALLPALQKSLPVAEQYKKEVPAVGSDLNVYDAVYYAGDCNAAGKTIAINLPNDPEVQLKKGSRKLQLKNTMSAKFDKILLPISDVLIDSTQRKHVTFNAFFENVMFHEVAHGLGIKKTINGKGDVRKVLKEQYSAIEEAKADILGVYMVGKLAEMGELPGNVLMDNYTTFVAGIFRSVRFGASSAHGKANMFCFSFFEKENAFTRNNDGTYRVNFEEMKQAISKLAELILTLQGNGDYEQAVALIKEQGVIGETLANDLKKIEAASIPRDIRFKQGAHVLGIE